MRTGQISCRKGMVMSKSVRLMVVVAMLAALGSSCSADEGPVSSDTTALAVEATTESTTAATDEDPPETDEPREIESGEAVSEDAKGSASGFLIGTTTELPQEFGIPAPAGGAIVAAYESNEALSATLVYEADLFDEIVAFYDDWATGTGESLDSWTNDYLEGDIERHRSTWTDDADDPNAATATTVSVVTCEDKRDESDGGPAACVYTSEPRNG